MAHSSPRYHAFLYIALGFSGPGGLDVLAAGAMGDPPSELPTAWTHNGTRWINCIASGEGPDYGVAEARAYAKVAFDMHDRVIPEWLGMKILTFSAVCGREGERESARKAMEWFRENPPLRSSNER